MQKPAFILFITLGLFHFSSALDLTRLDLSYQYDTKSPELTVDYRVVQGADGISVYYRLNLHKNISWTQRFLTQPKYKSVKHDTLQVYTLDTLRITGRQAYFKLTIPTPEHALLLLVSGDPKRGLYQVQDIPIKSPIGFPSFVPMTDDKLPVLDKYVTTSEISVHPDTMYHVFAYDDNFGPADPAMGIMKPLAPNLTIDSSFYFEKHLKDLDDHQFYLIQQDTLAPHAITLLKCPEHFPKYRKLEELIPPLTYITTPKEIQQIMDKGDKKTFENFWINTYGTKFRAKNAIRTFYQAVEDANRLFTDYKPGWKTDRGIIYIVFGKPDNVMRDEQKEIWTYNDGTRFEFIRISTLFTPALYSLKRDRKYENTWYDQVGEIRKGI
ncbi:GWxTD domain-containing protein [Marinoscillum furvescens]|uniref:GWxTD domain-containing protein n=1 Tax=Marinoscillum furvescens DSM 4134 TaxID=1122208 RepID=A0A3D9L4J3_MARFU|nr:GWxTD domain-containing protein [Marinoscillum furvescens]RED99725.1 GWxTD domain-containing protein [Marinoscillum furvescens DSM 4134]